MAGDLAFLLLLLLSFTETEQGGITNDPETERLVTTILIISSFRLPGTWAWLTSRASASASGLGSLKVKVSGGTVILSRLGWEGPVPRLTWNVAVGRMSSA